MPPAPPTPGRTRGTLPPPDCAAAGLPFPPLTWALRPRPHVTRFPDPTATPPTLPGCSPPPKPRAVTRPPARSPPGPGSAATYGPQAGAAPGPSPAARRGRAADRPPPLPQRAPHSPRRRSPGSSSLGPTQAWLSPQSIHVPCRLLGTLAQPPRPHCKGATVCCPGRCLRLVPARAVATNAASHPGAGRPASVEPNRPGRAPPAGARCICREAAAHWPAGGGACGAGPIEFRPGSAARSARGGTGLLRVIRGAAADGTQPPPARVGTRSEGGIGPRRLGEERRARRLRRRRRAGDSRRVCRGAVPLGGQDRPSPPKKTRNAVTAVVFKS